MDDYFLASEDVAFDDLFLDVNNPRLAPEAPPGYADPKVLFDPARQAELEKRVCEVYDVAELEERIIALGWIPMDPIVVWHPPRAGGKRIVLEGNTRTTALRRIRRQLPKAEKKYDALKKKKGLPEHELQEAERRILRIRDVIEKTKTLRVFPASARDAKRLEEILPRIMSVRHIQGAKQWSKNAEGLYILRRYERLFAARHGREPLRLDADLIEKVADEVSLGERVTRRKIQAASAFGHFSTRYEDRLPEGEKFRDTDQWLFEVIASRPFLREQFGFSMDQLHVSEEGEEALFEWVFAKPRGNTEEENPNIVPRHEMLLEWVRMKAYDSEHKTSFAARFDVSNPTAAPSMAEVTAEFRLARQKKAPIDVVNSLIKELEELDTKTKIAQASHLLPLLGKLGGLVDTLKKWLAASRAA